MQQIPIYLITGFLESGKTSFLRDVLMGGDFDDGQRGLLILCEEGEEEYDEKALAQMNISMITVDEEEEFNPEFLKTCEKHYRPKRIFIEMNGMWDCKWLFGSQMPYSMDVAQIITVVDGSTFPVYLNNMRSILSNLFLNTEMVVFNRCSQDDPLPAYRRGIKVANQKAEVIFEDEEGEIDDIFQDEMPFDLDAPIVEILPEDYGIWFVDAMDHPETYAGKTLRFKGRVLKPRGMGSKFFVPGRTAMTCCADDTTFLGYVCKSEDTPGLRPGQWVEVTAKAAVENRMEYQGEGIVLYAESVQPCEPLEEEMVYFN